MSSHEHETQTDDLRVMLMETGAGGLSPRRERSAHAARKCALETGARGWRYAVRAH